MFSIASQITILTIIYSAIHSGAYKKKTSKLRLTGLCARNSPVTGESPAQMDSNAENVSIWWRYHSIQLSSFANVGCMLTIFDNHYIFIFLPHLGITKKICSVS